MTTEPITAERQAELDARIAQFADEAIPPFWKKRLREADMRYLLQIGHKDFRYAVLSNANLNECNLNSVDFQGAEIDTCYFVGAELESANFSDAKVYNCVFLTAQMRWTNFRRAQIRYCDFRGAPCRYMHLDTTVIESCDFRQADLAGANFTFTTTFQNLSFDIGTEFPTDQQPLIGMILEEHAKSAKHHALAAMVSASPHCWKPTTRRAIVAFDMETVMWAAKVLYPWFTDHIEAMIRNFELSDEKLTKWRAKREELVTAAEATKASIVAERQKHIPETATAIAE